MKAQFGDDEEESMQVIVIVIAMINVFHQG